MIKIYRKKVKEAEVETLSNIMVQEFLYTSERYAGVFGLDVKTGLPIVIHAKAALLATGGRIRIYPIITARGRTV